MSRILKIYDTDQPIADGNRGIKILEKYPAFTLVEVGENTVDELKDSYLVEDITGQYGLPSIAGGLDTSSPRISKQGKTLAHPAYGGTAPLPKGPHHYIVQFVGPIKESWLAQARKAGAVLVEPYEGFSYIARIDQPDLEKVSSLRFVRWLGHFPYDARIASGATARAPGEADARVPRTRLIGGVYTVEFFRPEQATEAVPAVKKLGFEVLEENKSFLIVESKHKSAESLAQRIEDLARVHGVRRISERPIRRRSNDRAAGIMGTAAALGNPGLGLSGAGEIIAVSDTGLDSGNPASIHPDFAGRIKFIKSYPITPDFNKHILNPGGNDGPADLDSGHGTHTAGSVLGDGTASSNLPGLAGRVRGFSHRAQLVFQAIEQEMKWKKQADLVRNGRFILSGIPTDLGVLFAEAYAKGARIHSNSWGGGAPGAYDEQCRRLDEFVWNKPDFCILFSAGNDGTDRDADGVVDFGSVTSPGTAKNCITVGACENRRPEFTGTYGESWSDDYPAEPIKSDRMADDPEQVVAFSSRGPTQDGRIKPDVVAPGTYILSTRSRFIAGNHFGWGRFPPSKLYMFDSGTSMATPLTAGAVGIIREHLRRDRGIASPSAALLKALLIAGARPIGDGTSIFDNHQGFGRVDVDPIVAPAPPLRVLFMEHPGLKTGNSDERTVNVLTGATLLRIALVYSDFPGAQLVNNLNLIVRGPDGSVRVGNGGSSASSFDADNNVEVVHIRQAAQGTYRIQVVASNVPRGPQPYALVVRGVIAPQL